MCMCACAVCNLYEDDYKTHKLRIWISIYDLLQFCILSVILSIACCGKDAVVRIVLGTFYCLEVVYMCFYNIIYTCT